MRLARELGALYIDTMAEPWPGFCFDLSLPACARQQRPTLGRIEAHCTDWTPISTRWRQFEEEIDASDPSVARCRMAAVDVAQRRATAHRHAAR